jgi:hypothetical protein
LRGEERRGEKRHLTYKVPYFEEFGDIWTVDWFSLGACLTSLCV